MALRVGLCQVPGKKGGPGSKKAMQQRMQGYKRRMEDSRARMRARTLPSLSSLPLRFGRAKNAP
eukprot:4329260-Pyramimonas_sp.AAC.1